MPSRPGAGAPARRPAREPGRAGGALEETRAQIAEHHRFKELSRRLVEASEALCRARLAAGRDAGQNPPRKGAPRVADGDVRSGSGGGDIDALAGPGAADGIDFEVLETAVRRQALGLAARLVERRLNADCGFLSITDKIHAGNLAIRKEEIDPLKKSVAGLESTGTYRSWALGIVAIGILGILATLITLVAKGFTG